MPSVVGLPRQTAQAGALGIGSWSTFHTSRNEAGSAWGYLAEPAWIRCHDHDLFHLHACSDERPQAYHVRTTDTPFRNRNAPAEEVVDLSAGACAMPAATSLTVQCQSARINSGALEPGGLWY